MTDNEEKFDIDKVKDSILKRVKEKKEKLEVLKNDEKLKGKEKKDAIITKFSDTKKALLKILKELSDVTPILIFDGEGFLDINIGKLSNIFHRYYCNYEEKDILYFRYEDGKKAFKGLFRRNKENKGVVKVDSIKDYKDVDLKPEKIFSSLKKTTEHLEIIILESLDNN